MSSKKMIAILLICTLLFGCGKNNMSNSKNDNDTPIEQRYQEYLDELSVRPDTKFLKVATDYTGKCGQEYAANEVILGLDNKIYVDANHKTGLDNDMYILGRMAATTTINDIYDIMKINYGSCEYVDILALDKKGELFYINNYLGKRMLTLTKIKNVSYISSAIVKDDHIYVIDLDNKEYDITEQIHDYNPEYK